MIRAYVHITGRRKENVQVGEYCWNTVHNIGTTEGKANSEM